MQPSDPPADPDADPTRIRPDRQAAHRAPEDPLAAYRLPVVAPGAHRLPDVGPDASDDGDAAPTAVRPRFRPASELDQEAVTAAADQTPDVVHEGTGSEGLDHWVRPALAPASAVQSGRDLFDGGGPGGHPGYDDLDGAPTTADSAWPTYPSHRQSRRATLKGWLARREGGARAYTADAWLARREGGARAYTADAPSGSTDDPDGAPTTVLTVAHDDERQFRRPDWAWVEEWRAERSAPAWGPGIALGSFVALIVAVALIVLTAGVSDSPVLAVVFNVIIAAGMAPALWLCRSLPVLRFLAAGAAAGIVFGWIAMLTTF